MSNLLKIIISFWTLFLLTFQIFRFATLAFYWDQGFHELGFQESILGFVYGIRFDVSIMFAFLAPAWLLTPLLAGSLRNWAVNLACLWSSLVWVVFSFIMLVDWYYFSEVKRHLFDEPVMLINDLDFTAGMFQQSHILKLILFFIVSVSVLWVFWKFFINRHRIGQKDYVPWKSRIVWFFILIFIQFVGIRGSLGLKPIGIVDAFYSPKASSGHLAMNGVFSSIRSSLVSQRKTYNFFATSDLDSIFTSANVKRTGSYWFRSSLASQEPSKPKPHVFILLLESMGSHYVDGLSDNNFNATPFLDSLLEKSKVYPNFYSVGSRSIEAIQSILSSFPSLRGLPTLGLGFELMSVERLGEHARRQGYTSAFLQSGKRKSFRLGAISRSFGFDKYYGWEDYPSSHENIDSIDPLFGWDDWMFQFVVDKMDAWSENGPVLNFIFTGTTHSPFVLPPSPLVSEPHGIESESGYLNTLRYTDWSLERFFEKAETKPWFSNSVFLIMADHTLQRFQDSSFLDRFSVPLVIYEPSNSNMIGIDKRYSSHLDILPTILHKMGVTAPISTLGESVLNDSSRGYVTLTRRYGNPAIVSKKGYLIHNLEKTIESKLNETCDEKCKLFHERFLLGTYQYLSQSISDNSWTPSNTQSP